MGAGGRLLPGGRGPKYKNTSGTPVYDKSRILYGLNWAKKAVVESGQVVMCEGYTDVIGLHQAGIASAVATTVEEQNRAVASTKTATLDVRVPPRSAVPMRGWRR